MLLSQLPGNVLMFLAKVFIRLKPTVNDPEGQIIQSGLHQLGFKTVSSVRAGKYIEVCVGEDTRETATQMVKEMCQKLLANPVIEDYHFDLEELVGES